MLVIAIILSLYTQFSTASEKNTLQESKTSKNLSITNRNALQELKTNIDNKDEHKTIPNTLEKITSDTKEKTSQLFLIPNKDDLARLKFFDNIHIFLKGGLGYHPQEAIDIVCNAKIQKEYPEIAIIIENLSKGLTNLDTKAVSSIENIFLKIEKESCEKERINSKIFDYFDNNNIKEAIKYEYILESVKKIVEAKAFIEKELEGIANFSYIQLAYYKDYLKYITSPEKSHDAEAKKPFILMIFTNNLKKISETRITPPKKMITSLLKKIETDVKQPLSKNTVSVYKNFLIEKLSSFNNLDEIFNNLIEQHESSLKKILEENKIESEENLDLDENTMNLLWKYMTMFLLIATKNNGNITDHNKKITFLCQLKNHTTYINLIEHLQDLEKKSACTSECEGRKGCLEYKESINKLNLQNTKPNTKKKQKKKKK